MAIIALLAYLGMPALGRFFDSAKSTQSMGNLRQIAAAALSMAADNNGILDLHESEGGNYKANATLPHQLYSKGYIKDPKIFMSPEINASVTRPFLDMPWDGWRWRTYAIVQFPDSKNPGFFRPVPSSGSAGGVYPKGFALRLATAEALTSFPMILDSTAPIGAGKTSKDVRPSWVCLLSQNGFNPVMRDDRTVKIAFADGHVEAAAMPRLWQIFSRHYPGNYYVVNSKGAFVQVKETQ